MQILIAVKIKIMYLLTNLKGKGPINFHMKKRYCLLITLLFIAIFSYAQYETNMIDKFNLKPDIVSKDKKVMGLLKKDPWLKGIHRFQLFHVLMLGYKGEFKKEDFINHTFLNKLRPLYKQKNSFFGKRRSLISDVYIGDSTGNLIGMTDGSFIQSSIRYKVPYDQSEIKLFDMIYKKELD